MSTTNFAQRMSSKWGEFTEIGIELFDSEELTDNLIKIYLGLISGGWKGHSPETPVSIDKISDLYTNGLSLSCVKRVAISGQLDLRNDGLADFAAIPVQAPGGADFEFAVCSRVEKLPRGWSSLPFSNHILWAGSVFRDRLTDARTKRQNQRVFGEKESLTIDAWYYCIVGDKVLPCRRQGWPNGGPAADLSAHAAAAMQTVSDLKALWNVETKEQALSHRSTPIRLGVDAEIIKSLFYSRQAPMTETGRRRPILHWVRSHQRRLREGIDIDIRNHLRGITEFEMDGFPFKITSPIKRLDKAA